MEGSTEEPQAQGSAAIECLCGIPNCPGHELIDGEVSIKGHPGIPDGDYAFTPPNNPRPSTAS
jgi:hypothetical protein